MVLCFHLIELNMISGELQYQTSKYLGGVEVISCDNNSDV